MIKITKILRENKALIGFILIGEFTYLLHQPAFAASGADFLRIGVGAKATGMGHAFTAVADDASALYWNPAGLAQLERKELSLMHTELFENTRLDSLAYVHPTRIGSFGMGMNYLSQGKISGRSLDRKPTSDFSASDMSVTLGFSRTNIPLSVAGSPHPVTLGMNIKLLESKIARYSSTGFALDAGSLLKANVYRQPVNVGFAVQNIGPKMKYLEEGYDLPLTLSAGLSLPVRFYQSNLLISSDLKHEPYNAQTSFSVGVDYSLIPSFSLRTGYLMSAKSSQPIDPLIFPNLGAGFGLRMGPGTLDYAFSPHNDLGMSQRMTFSYKF